MAAEAQQISIRVLYRWEQLVYRAKMAAEAQQISRRALYRWEQLAYRLKMAAKPQVNIESILKTADELANKDRDVARILRDYAYTLLQDLDPNRQGRGVLQFKTALLVVIKAERSRKEGEKIDRSHDVQILQDFYQHYRMENIIEQREQEYNVYWHSGSCDEDSTTTEQRADGQRKMYFTARILNEVIDGLIKYGQPEEFDSDLKRIMEEDAKKVNGFKAYDILPLETPGVANVFQSVHEVVPTQNFHLSYSSSSTSKISSGHLECSGSGPLRAPGGKIEVPQSLELHKSATCSDEEPLYRAENARSASCPEVGTSDVIIEDVVKKYTWDQVLHMTNDLTSRQLGKGGFGAVYLGKLENGEDVAVKILDASSQQGISEFLNEVNLLKRVNHVNLVKLLGYCQGRRQVLIYEFAEEGSVWDHLQGGKCLNWKQRLNIALQSACGLEYLHTGCSPRVIHRDIKSQNILLTKSMVAKVADFGLSKLGSDRDNICKTHITTMVKGTLGYLDPEYLKTGQLTEKSDVYSFGVFLLEIVTGRKPIQGCFIGDWVENHYNNGAAKGLKTVADSSLGGHYNRKALKLVIDLAKTCTQPSGASRPKMMEVTCVLRKAQVMELDEKKSSKWLPLR